MVINLYQIKLLILRSWENDLSDDEQTLLIEHCLNCPQARLLWRHLHWLRSMRTGDELAPDGLSERVMDGLELDTPILSTGHTMRTDRSKRCS